MSESLPTFQCLDDLWSALLSRQAEQVRLAYRSLDAEQQRSVRAHLLRMVHEPGWHAEQRISAQAALDALQAEA
jgi:hypothetical protein